MSDGQTDVDIIPEYPIAATTFYDNRSFGGVVDFLIAKLPTRYTRKGNRYMYVMLGILNHSRW